MNDRMSDERLAEIYAKDLRTHVDPDLDDIIDELLTALKAEREAIEQLEAATYRSEWGDLAKLHEEFKQHIAKQAKIIAAVEAVLIDHKGFHYGDNAVSVLCALEDALKGTCNVQNIR